MTLHPARPSRMPRRRWRIPVLLGALALALVVAVALAVETRPRAGAAGPPDAAAARAALSAGATLRDFVDTGGAAGALTLRAAEIDATLAALARLAPGAHAAARLEPGPATLVLSLGPPHLPAPLWANLSLGFAAGPGGLEVASARLGRLPLPGGLVEAGIAAALDRLLDAPGLGRAALAGVTGLDVANDGVTVALGYDAATRADLIARLRARLNFGDATQTGPIYAHLWWFDELGDDGALPRAGSVTPYLRQVVTRSARMARRWPEASDRERLASGFLALALYCGEPALGASVGVRLKDHMRGDANHCEATTLGGRDDLKRHFIVSAALLAASTGPAAFGIGEFKELIDSGAGGSGFSFDDMAANLAGARFAAAFLNAPQAAWPAMLARVTAEEDILPNVSDLPSRMTETEFRARFGAVDSPAYREMVAKIRRRVDALPFHRAPRGG